MTFKATWKGEEATPELEKTTRWGITFEKGKAVEIGQKNVAVKLSVNPNFTCDGSIDSIDQEPLTHTPPSQATMPGAVPKGGEAIFENPVFGQKPPPEVGPKAATATKLPPLKKV